MKIYARLALALLSCGTALLLATGGVAANTAKHAATVSQTEGTLEAADIVAEAAADTTENQVTDATPAVAPADEEDTDEDADEDGPEEDGEVENLLPDHQPAPAATGTHHDEAAADVAGASGGVNQADAAGDTKD